MRPNLRLAVFALLLSGLGLGLHALARHGAAAIEAVLAGRVGNGLAVLGADWARVEADGLVITLRGDAPDIDAQSLAVEASRTLGRFGRVRDRTTARLAPPERREPVEVEFHRDDNGLTLIGRVPDAAMRDALIAALASAEPGLMVHDLTGLDAAWPPRGWGTEIAVALAAIRLMPRAFVRIAPGRVLVEGTAADADARDRMEADLIRHAGPNIALTTAIRVPARVIVPFAFIAEKAPGGGLHLVACAARTEAEAAEIDRLRQDRQMQDGPARCPAGLGGPHGDWPGAVRAGLAALAALPAGRVEITYRSVTLDAAPPTRVETFEATLASLSHDLPPGFDLSGAVTAGGEAERAAAAKAAYWLRMVRLGERFVLEGKVADAAAAVALRALAAAQVGQAGVDAALTSPGTAPPAGWQQAALAAVEALSQAPGAADLTAKGLVLRARLPGAAAARLLHDRLNARMPDSLPLRTEVRVDLPALVAALPLDPRRCVADLNRAVRGRGIQFDPGRARIDPASREGIDTLAAILHRCPVARVEIGGHTDNQGGDDLNERLSRNRAEAVLDALLDAGIRHDRLAAQGYGAREPIAPNDTPEGRAQNRRIAFRLLE
ncbi:MAG: OmpA family protein [Thermohalobaculum sp.]|nr:OmpA family protein [Thermohalobaculum sp.]